MVEVVQATEIISVISHKLRRWLERKEMDFKINNYLTFFGNWKGQSYLRQGKTVQEDMQSENETPKFSKSLLKFTRDTIGPSNKAL